MGCRTTGENMAEIKTEYELHAHVTRHKVTTTTIKLTRADIITAVKNTYGIKDMPDDAKVTFVSQGMTIDVDEENPVSITYTTETNEGG